MQGDCKKKKKKKPNNFTVESAVNISRFYMYIKGEGYLDRPISAYNQVPIFSLMCSPICLLLFIVLYRTSCRKPYFRRYRELEVGRVTMYDKIGRHKYCFKSVEKCFSHANIYINRHYDV